MNETNGSKSDKPEKSDFIRDYITEDIRTGRYQGRVETRFPPEPNGYLHIGHAKSICINFGIAAEYKSVCHLRFDDTNPAKEDVEYVDSIMADIRWLGFDWGKHLYYASDYYQQLYEHAVKLIKKGKAYVCHLTADETREYRGTLTKPGRNSPYRDRSIEENLLLFEKMKAGEFPDGHCVLRAKIDMASPNLNMRDPIMYRIVRAAHHRTGDKWCIYPMYDYAHPVSDAIENITHSICTLEFEDHRPLYDWAIENCETPAKPRQIEFARLNLTFTVMSKRKLLQLVKENFVTGWDDPRMPTIAGLRRRGCPPSAIRTFADRIGVAKANSTVDISLLEYCLREELNRSAPRVMTVLKPLKIIIDNYPDDNEELLEAENNPEDASAGTRKIPFSKVLFIEEDDFKEVAPKKYFRLSPGMEVRLKHAYYIKAVSVVKDSSGKITEVHCTFDPDSKGGWTKDERKVMGTLHWVSVKHGIDVEVRMYDRLFTKENPDAAEEGKTFLDYMNPESLTVLKGCKAEPGLSSARPGGRFQFLRQGYFSMDPDSKPGCPVFNRIVTLKDTWAKIEKKG